MKYLRQQLASLQAPLCFDFFVLERTEVVGFTTEEKSWEAVYEAALNAAPRSVAFFLLSPMF